MLLHWATSYQKLSGRAASQAVLHDLLSKILSEIDEKDEIWKLVTCSDENEDMNEEETYLTHELATEEEKWHPVSYAEEMDKDKELSVAKSLEILFANRKRWDQWKVQLMAGLHVLASRIDKIILTGMVGKATLDASWTQPTQKLRKKAGSKKKTMGKQIDASDLASQIGNANRGSKSRKGSKRSLSEPTSAILTSRNIKRRKRSSPLPRCVKAPNVSKQQRSKH